jgi:aerobic carbon-monoxide dehydrogenase medium subunit
MLLESVSYTRPATVAEALEALASREGAAPLAGGQSLINVLKNRVASVELLVDISRLEELRTVAVSDGALEIGACVTYDEIDRSAEIRASHGILAHVASHIEDQQIRNRGTIGGNCCLSDPTNNLPPLLIALDATMNIASPSGPRRVAADEFFKGYFTTAVEPGEILRSISIPALGEDAGAGYNTLSVASDSKAIVRAAAKVRGNGTIEEARVVLAAIGPVPIRHAGMEQALRGASVTADSVREATDAIGDELEPTADAHGSAEYRREMARVVARRAVNEAIARGGQRR